MPTVDDVWDLEWLFHSSTTNSSDRDEFTDEFNDVSLQLSTFPNALSSFDLSAMAGSLPLYDNVVSHGATILQDFGAAMTFNPPETLTADEDMIVELHGNDDERSYSRQTTSATDKLPVEDQGHGDESMSLRNLQLDKRDLRGDLNNQFNPALLWSQNIFRTGPGSSEPLETGQHVFQGFKPKRTRKNKKKVEVGNNQCGKLGKLRCKPCRKRKSKCIFTTVDIPCDFCQAKGIGNSCIKKWGEKKEESMAIIKEAEEKSMTVSRQIPTAIDKMIRPQDVSLLQFAYSDNFISSGGGSVIGHLLRHMGAFFSPSINSEPLRHAVLALAAAFVPPSEISFFERLEYHKGAAYGALRKKDSSTVDESDLFAVCLLAFLSSLYEDRTEFAIHYGGFVSIMKQLYNKGTLKGGSTPLGPYWPLARDIILSDCRRVDQNENSLGFCYFSQKTIGPQNFKARQRYFSKLFGVPPERLRLYTYSESVWIHVLLLRRCFRSTVYRQMKGGAGTSSVVASIVSEVSSDLHSPEITRILKEIYPDDSVKGAAIDMDPAWGKSFVYTILLHHFCELLIVHLNADSVLQSASSLETIRAAGSLVRFLKTEWNILDQIPQVSTDRSLKNLLSRWMIPRMLWMAGLTFTKRSDLQVSKWIIFRMVEFGEPRMARALESFWDHGDPELLASLLDMTWESIWPYSYYW